MEDNKENNVNYFLDQGFVSMLLPTIPSLKTRPGIYKRPTERGEKG